MSGRPSAETETSSSETVSRLKSELARVKTEVHRLEQGHTGVHCVEEAIENLSRTLETLEIEEGLERMALSPTKADPDVGGFAAGHFTAAEVLQFLAFNEKTGTARIHLLGELLEFDLRRGFVVDARSSNSPPGHRIGELLVARGAIQAAALEDFLRRHAGSSKRLGRGLLAERLVKRKHVCLALRDQCTRALARVIRAQDASIEFMPRPNPYGSVDLHLDLNRMLLEAAALADVRA